MNPNRSLSAITRRALRINYTSPSVCLLRAVSSGSGTGSGSSATLDILPVVRRDGPASLTIEVLSATSVRLTWSTKPYIYSYVVYRATSALGPFTQVTANQIDNAFTDEGLAAGTYYYKVTGIEPNAGETTASPTTSVTVP